MSNQIESDYYHVMRADGTYSMDMFKTRAAANEAAKQTNDGIVVGDLDKPSGLAMRGEKAYYAILDYLVANKLTSTGGCRTFYSPRQWSNRGEEYGKSGHLIVVYDGSQVSHAFSLDKCYARGGADMYKHYEAMQAELEKLGMYFEECTGWYSAIYSSK